MIDELTKKVRWLAWERPLITTIALAAVVCLLVAGVWRLGAFELLELELYDRALRLQPKRSAEKSPVLVIGMTDEDIKKYGWPLNDARLSELLEQLAKLQPSAIGLDLYRDLPEPRIGPEPGNHSGEWFARLGETFTNHANIIGICNLESRTLPPPALTNYPDRVGFNDFGADDPVRKIVRRGSLYMDENGIQYTSFAFRLATLYLEGMDVEFEPDSQDPRRFRFGKFHFRRFESNDGTYVGADSKGYQFLLDFKGPNKFQTNSIDRVLSRQIPPESVRGKIVLIGVTSETVNDPINTPLDTIRHGVELHAHTTEQLVRAALEGDQPIRSWPEPVELLWIAGWGALGALLGYGIRSPLHLAFAIVGCLLCLLAAFWIDFRFGWWVPTVSPAAACLPCAALVTSYKLSLERQQRGVLMQLFSRHVSKDIAEAIWAQRSSFMDGNRPRPQQLTATVLFTDLKGFSTISERLEPAQLIHWTSCYLEEMAAIVIEHEGVINKFIGDAVMAVFGVPVARSTQDELRRDATNAVRSALAMGRGLARLNERWKAEGLPSASMRIGIFTGPLVAGSVGYTARLEYTVIGDTVNTAARLESFDKDMAGADGKELCCRILIGEPTLRLLTDKFEANLIGSLKVKGKDQKVTIYQILHEKDQNKILV